MNVLDQALGLSPTALRLRSQRSEVLASNIANADTPNYHARDYDFKSVLRNALDGHTEGLTATDDKHLSLLDKAELGQTLYRQPTKTKVNGNTVEEEVEQAAFSENAVQYQTSLQFLNGTLRTLRMAIKGE
ncbi:MAG TPA: flagellar basal body rod protein FlgB [Candidatus Acidoferrum sp.]|nr:flagellar basal body rod protein FlgB [Candidatus Acidoferrum sp.]